MKTDFLLVGNRDSALLAYFLLNVMMRFLMMLRHLLHKQITEENYKIERNERIGIVVHLSYGNHFIGYFTIHLHT